MKEIKEALSKLQDRPWEAKKGAGWFVQIGEAIAIVEKPAIVGMKIEEDTAKFIAKSPEYVASLISKVEEMQKALEISKETLRELYFQVGQDMDINPSAKTVYLSKIAFANNNLKGDTQ